MSYKHIVVNIGQPVSPNRAQVAANLAATHGAYLAGRYYGFEESGKRKPSAPIAAGGVAAQEAAPAPAAAPEETREGRRARDVFDHAVAQTAANGRFEAAPAASRSLSACLTDDAQCSDLTLVGKPVDGDADADLVKKIAHGVGGAVVVVPESATQAPGARHVVIAWNGSAAAARSIQHAMPMIEAAGQVTIAMVNPREKALSSARRLQDVLEAHGANVETKTDTANIATADSLVSRAEELGADVLVMGAFGQSRLGEVVTGGSTTNRVIQHATVPVLLAG